MMPMSRLLALLLLAAGPALAQDHACPPRGETYADEAPLPGVRAAIGRARLHVLAVGSATTAGPGAELVSFPQRMVESLRRRVPGLEVGIEARGGRGTTAADHAATIEAEIARARPDLVIWQTGTVEAVRGLEPDALAAQVSATLQRLRQAGIDVLIVEPQFSRFLRANANIDPYLEALRITASLEGVPILRRYDIMRAWADDGAIDVERAAPADRPRTLDLLNQCLGRALARLALRGAQREN